MSIGIALMGGGALITTLGLIVFLIGFPPPVTDDVLLDLGLAADGSIVLVIHDKGYPAETEIVMSIEEARAFVRHLEAVIAVAEALPAGRRISMDEGRA